MSFNKKYISNLLSPINLVVLFSVISIISYVIFFTFESLNHIISFNGYAANGAFQLMNPLERMDIGQVVGRDFQFFHGPGVLLAHYPLFKIFGGGLFGSEMSRWFTSLLLFIGTGFIFCWAWFYKQKNSIKKAIFAFALLFILTSLTSEVITPSNSLLGVRTTIPLLIGILYLFRPSKIFKILGHKLRLFDILITFLVALSIVFGTEQGISALVAILILELLYSLHKNKSLSVLKSLFLSGLRVLWLCLLTGIFLLITFTVTSLGHPVESMKFVLSEVPNEQFWYYGGEPQGFLDLSNLLGNLKNKYMLLVYALLSFSFILLLFFNKKKIISKNQVIASTFLLIYGVFSLAGILSYYNPLQQIMAFTRTNALIITMLLCSGLFIYFYKQNNPYKSIMVIAICSVLLGFSINELHKVKSFEVEKLTISTISNVTGNHDTLLGQKWVDRLSAFKQDISQAKSSPVPLWSTYASLYELSINQTHPSTQGHDYIIHALGPDRRAKYAQDFKDQKPELVTTLRQSYFIFEEWLWARHWDFYLPLTENYKIIKSNDSHFLWEKAEPIQNSSEKTTLSIVDNKIELPSYNASKSELIEVTVTYTTDSQWSKVPFVKKLPRYMVRPHNTLSTIGISLPPYETKWVFPIVLDKNKVDAELVFSADGLLPGTKLNITNAQYRPIKTYPENMIEFTERFNLGT